MASKTHLYLSSQVATLTSALFGYTVGLIGGLIVLPSFLRHFAIDQLSERDHAAASAKIVTLWLVGALFGVPIGIPVCARGGRRVCLALSAVLYVVGAVLQLAANDLVQFEVGRAINGLGVGVGTLVGPMYISEISPPADRGMLMSGYQTVLQLSALVGFWGSFVTNALFDQSSNLQWQLPIVIQLVPGILLLAGTLIIPDTPQFLISKRDWKRAAESLVWIRQADDAEVEHELNGMKLASEAVEISKEHNQTPFIKEILRRPIRNRLGVGIGLMVAQNMMGLNALNYYAPVIFMSAGFTSVSSSLFLTGVFGLVKLISATSFMFYFVRIKGNRFWLKLGSLVCGTSMLVLAYFVRTLTSGKQQSNEGLTIGGAVSVLMVYTFAFAFGVSLGPISWNVCAEIFPLHINTKCCAITTCTQWLFQIVIAGITPRLIAVIGWGTYIVYAVFCFLTLWWVTFYVPETRGVALGSAMDSLFDQDTHPRQHDSLDEDVLEEVDERSALIFKHQEVQRRRSSFAGLA